MHNGQSECFGLNSEDMSRLGLKSITAGYYHNCATLSDDIVSCWGVNNSFGQLNNPTYFLAKDIKAGIYNTCAIRKYDGLVQCWGDNRFGQSMPPSGVVFKKLAPAYVYTCGIREQDNFLQCWGNSQFDLWEREFFHIASGMNHTCAIDVDGLIICWGENTFGQAMPPYDVGLNSIAAGTYHNCGISSDDGTAVCWGKDNFRQSQPPEGIAFLSISAGDNYTCGIVEGDKTEVCWGLTARNMSQ
jgi:alpha-tubulin suppressor-like RCC1 family protein